MTPAVPKSTFHPRQVDALDAAYQPLDADLTAVAASGIAAAWTAYTPTITAQTGTFTSVASSGRYLIVGKTVFIQVAVAITTNGTAAGFISASLPVACIGNYEIVGRKFSTNEILLGSVGSVIAILKYDGTYPGGDGVTVAMSGVYEST